MIEPIALYMEAFWQSPWDCTCFVALREKGLQFQTSIAMIREGVGAIDALRARTITGRSPVLQHGQFWVAESIAIIEYLEDAFPAPGWPRLFSADLRQRARARQVLSWLRTTIEPLREERPSALIFYPQKEVLPPMTPRAQRCADRLLEVAVRLGVDANGRAFDEFGIVDLDLAFALMRLVRSGDPVPAPVVAYAEAVWARPSVREFVEHPRPPNAPRDR